MHAIRFVYTLRIHFMELYGLYLRLVYDTMDQPNKIQLHYKKRTLTCIKSFPPLV